MIDDELEELEGEDEPEELTTTELLELHRLWLKAYDSLFASVLNLDMSAVSDIGWAIEVELAQRGIMPDDIPTHNVRNAGRKPKVTPAIREQIITLNQSGVSVRKIAAQIGVSPATVQRVLTANRAVINSDT